MMIKINHETPSELDAIWQINNLAFGRPEEADLVNHLRQAGALAISLVAVLEGRAVGHIAFSPMSIEHHPEPTRVIGLAPLAVLPEFQRQGIGLQLTLAGLEACTQAGYDIAIVLGHPEFYPRAGFERASAHGIFCGFEVPDEVYMVKELKAGMLGRYSGKTAYHPAFDGVD